MQQIFFDVSYIPLEWNNAQLDPWRREFPPKALKTSPIILGMVSKAWRKIVYTTPHLFTRVFLSSKMPDPVRTANIYLENSGTLFFEVAIHFTPLSRRSEPNDEILDQIYIALAAKMHRIRVLYLHTSVRSVNRFLTTQANNLQQLYLDSISREDGFDVVLEAPNLRVLRIRQEFIQPCRNLILSHHHLTHLYLPAYPLEPSHFMDILLQIGTGLEVLDVHYGREDDFDDISTVEVDPGTEPILLHKLKLLKLTLLWSPEIFEYQVVFQRFKVPNLEALDLTIHSADPDDLTPLFSVQGLLDASSLRLKNLVFCMDGISRGHFADFLYNLPHLAELSLRQPYNAAIDALCRHIYPNVCPRLVTLKLLDPKASCDIVTEMLRSRISPDPINQYDILETVYIDHPERPRWRNSSRGCRAEPEIDSDLFPTLKIFYDILPCDEDEFQCL